MQSMANIKRNMNTRKRLYSLQKTRNVQSLQQRREKLAPMVAQLPDGAKARQMWDTVTGWVGDLEQIHDKVEPA